MIYLCGLRHRVGRIAIDRGTLRWRALTALGSDGPVAWDIECAAVPEDLMFFLPWSGWIEVARETAVQELGPLEDWQRKVLIKLSAMTL